MKEYYYKHENYGFMGPYNVETIMLADSINYNSEIIIDGDDSQIYKLKDIKELNDYYTKIKNDENFYKIAPKTSFILSSIATILFFPLGIVAFLTNIYSINLYYRGNIKAYNKYLDNSDFMSIFSIVLGAILLLIFYLNNYYITDIMYKY